MYAPDFSQRLPMSRIFVSHVEEDAGLSVQVAKGLEKAGYSTWYYERDSLPGVSYLLQTGDALEQCDAIVLVISKACLDSHQVSREVERAHECAKPIIPVLIDVSHNEFISRQPMWRQAIGTRASIQLPPEGVEGLLKRIIDGFYLMHLYPEGEAGETPSAAGATRRTIQTQHALKVLGGRVAIEGSDSFVFGFKPPIRGIYGRDSELDEISSLITDSDKEFICLYGPGGIGKSTLASLVFTHFIEGNRSHFNRCIWYDLRNETDPETTLLHLLTIATGDAVPSSSRDENPFDFWLNILAMRLRQEPMLVIFDDLESTFDPNAEAGTFNDERWPQLFRAFIGSNAAMVVTSQQVPKFSDPATELFRVQGISLENSIRLLRDAGLKDEERVFEEAHRFLQGHPMAVRAMAAAVVRRPRYRGLLSRAGDIMDAVRRCPDQTLNPVAFFDGVIQPVTMSKIEYSIITAMPVLLRAEDEEAISALLPELDIDDVAFALDELYLRSLVQADIDVDPPLYSLHPLVRDVAVKRLDDHASLHERIYKYYCKLPWDEDTKNPGDVEHLRQAAFHALALKNLALYRSVLYGDLKLSSRLQGWGRFDLSLPLHKREFEVAEEAGSDEDLMVAAGCLGKCLSRVGNISTALKHSEKALGIAMKLGDKESECEFRSQIGGILYFAGDYDESYNRLEEALKLAIETGNRVNEGICRGLLGLITSRRGDFDKAFSQLDKALNIAIEFRDTTSEMDWRSTIGQNHFLRGNYDEALEHLRPAMALAIEKGDQLHISKLGGLIGQVQTWKGDFKEAIAALEKALKVDREIGNRRHEGGLLALSALIHKYRGEFDIALKLAREAKDIAIEVGSKGGETYRIGLIGEIYLAMGEYHKAIGYLQKSCDYAVKIGSKTNECAWCGLIGEAYMCMGEYNQALIELENALEIAGDMKDSTNESEWLGKIGRLYLETGETDKAYDHLLKALYITLRVGNDPVNEKHHRELLGRIELNKGNPQVALKHFERVLEITRSLGMVQKYMLEAENRINETRDLCI